MCFSYHNRSSGVSLSARSGTFVTAVYSEVVCIGVFLLFTSVSFVVVWFFLLCYVLWVEILLVCDVVTL